MKLQKRSAEGKGFVDFTLEEAMAHECDGDDYGMGAVETANATACNTSRMLGKIVELLHSKNLLTEDEIHALLSNNWRKP